MNINIKYRITLIIIIIILIIVLLFIYNWYYQTELFYHIIYKLYIHHNKKNYKHYYKLRFDSNDNVNLQNSQIPKRVIPLYIFQTFYTKHLSLEMQESVNKIQRTNPEFTYIFADDDDCYEFIKNNFPPSVSDAYERLIPGAYKADLWRYCVLYIYGGIYLDIKFRPINGFKFINIVDKEHFVLDSPLGWNNNQYGIYNAFMICKPRNKLLLECIEEIVKNVQNRFYGNLPLDPTGPNLLGRIYSEQNDISLIDMCFNYCYKYIKKKEQIFYKNLPILEAYSSYRSEQKKSNNTKHYDKLWKDRLIYKE
jgi:mannosyltransferase OCH1-like enzyme